MDASALRARAADRPRRPALIGRRRTRPDQSGEASAGRIGTQPSTTASHWLRSSGVEFIGASRAEVRPGAVQLEPAHRTVPTDAVVALPLVRGTRLDGVPADEYDFIPVDRHGRARGLEAVYAAGDATDFPVKQGGLAAQQADAVAVHIAARLGAPVTPAPFRPVLHGMLFTGDDPRFLRTRDLADSDEGISSATPLWWPPTKIAGHHLGAYLFGGQPHEAFGTPPEGFADLEVELPTNQPEIHGN